MYTCSIIVIKLFTLFTKLFILFILYFSFYSISLNYYIYFFLSLHMCICGFIIIINLLKYIFCSFI